MDRIKVALSWSSGKDSAWALHLLRQDPRVEVVALITTFNAAFDRVAMHAVRRSLVEAQAQQTRIPLWPVELPWPCSNVEYEGCMSGLCSRATAAGISAMAFGDLFLQDIRDYRERQLAGTGLSPMFPLWNLPTAQLAQDMLAGGIRARLTCVDPSKLDSAFAGREFDSALLAELPSSVDPCGENGEFHTFVYQAPVFSKRINVQPGETVTRDGFAFADLLPTDL